MISILRAETDAEHAAVDEAFGHFDLSSPEGYARFLTAHARVVPGAERALAHWALPAWPPRTELLLRDLSCLHVAIPSPLEPAPPRSIAEAYGVQYVLQGSRLGGRLLARRVGTGLPASYLSAGHGPGEWQGFLANLAAAIDTPAAHRAAVEAARWMFARFREAALSVAAADPAASAEPE